MIAGIVGPVLLAAGLAGLWARQRPAAVPQPAAFSHRAHAEKEIACSYCHAHADEHRSAGMPPVESCATCHRFLPEAPYTQALLASAERREEIRWNRVYRLPSFIRFTHAAHARADVDCGACHGEVERQEEAVLSVVHTMSRCLDCHQRTGADADCLACHK